MVRFDFNERMYYDEYVSTATSVQHLSAIGVVALIVCSCMPMSISSSFFNDFLGNTPLPAILWGYMLISLVIFILSTLIKIDAKRTVYTSMLTVTKEGINYTRDCVEDKDGGLYGAMLVTYHIDRKKITKVEKESRYIVFEGDFICIKHNDIMHSHKNIKSIKIPRVFNDVDSLEKYELKYRRRRED